MTAFPAKFYRDPLEVLIALEEQSCTGCVHELKVEFQTKTGSEVKYACGRKNKKHGNRCGHYQERTNEQR